MKVLPNIAIFAPPNSGKTFSLRELANSDIRTLYINGDSKPLPWFGKDKMLRKTLKCPTQLPAMIEAAGNSGKFDVIVIDTLTGVVDDFQSRFVTATAPKWVLDEAGVCITDAEYVAVSPKTGEVNSLAAYGKLQVFFNSIRRAADNCPCTVVFLFHLSLNKREDGSYSYDAPMSGNIGKIGVSSLFSLCVVAKAVPVASLEAEPESPLLASKEESRKGTDVRYVFQIEKTKDTADLPIRSIEGTFPEGVHYMDNDLLKLLQHIESLYE